MEQLASILQAGRHPQTRGQELTRSRASTPPRSEAAEPAEVNNHIPASVAAAQGLTSDTPAPAPTTCQYCGRTLEHVGMTIPNLFPGKVVHWSEEPERCTCPQAVRFWENHDREEQQRAAEEARRKEQAAIQEKIGRLIRDSGMKGRFQNRTFDRWTMTNENRRAATICKRYANDFGIMLPTKGKNGKTEPPAKERNGLFLIGGYGTGKTHLAAAIANQLIQSGTPVICMTMIDLLARIRETYDRNECNGGASEGQIMRLYAEVPLLIIDDLGSEQPTEWGMTTIFSIVNARYEGYMPTIVTTNCGVDELVQRMTPRDASERNAQKTVDRLREMCIAVEMNWQSWRSK